MLPSAPISICSLKACKSAAVSVCVSVCVVMKVKEMGKSTSVCLLV